MNKDMNAIGIVRQMVADGQVSQEVAERYFPELKESEDERVWIINYLSNRILNSTIIAEKENLKKAIAWIEKQGEQKPTISYDALREGIGHYGITQYQIDNWLKKYVDVEKQDEQNLANSAKTCKDEQKPVPDWMPKFLDELRSKKNYFGWDEHRDFEGCIVAIINWMNPNYFNEKDGEQKPADKVEPKFHEGDWVFIEEVEGYKNGPFQIKTVESFGYGFDEYLTIPFMYENLISKWTIEDAKDGEVLELDCGIGIFKDKCIDGYNIHCYCYYSNQGVLEINKDSLYDTYQSHPATKEQRDALMKAMSDAGYTFDFEKKELKKIEQKSTYSEEEEKKQNYLIALLQNSTMNNPALRSVNEGLEEWLKSLKDRVRLQNGYNPYKEVVESIAEMCEKYKLPTSDLSDFFDNVKVKCKEAKEFDAMFPQKQWKPSDEQINALDEVYKTHTANNVCRCVLFNLMNDLKKLKE